MLLKRKPKIITEKAVLTQKKILNFHDHGMEVKKLYRMKYAIYNKDTEPSADRTIYQLTFMTQKGELIFFVNNPTYHQIKIDSLGILTRNRDLFVSFEVEKIATRSDVESLSW